MTSTQVIGLKPASDLKVRVLTALAFGAIYILWGSTYYAIRVAVAEIPPLQAAGSRFSIAGVVLFLSSWLRGTAKPTANQWRNTAILGVLMFLISYALLFWAEKSVPSGVASVLIAIIPIWTTMAEVLVFKRERWNPHLIVAVLAGLAGVILLTGNSTSRHAALIPCLGILVAGFSFSMGTVLSKSISLPESKPMSAGMQMMIGGVLLLICSVPLGERVSLVNVHWDGIVALGYLIVAGSIVSFTAFVWLLSRLPATKVASYAYVNPVVALALGHWLGNEVLTWKTFVAAGLVVGSVATILKTRKG